jgi:hypothetical protein
VLLLGWAPGARAQPSTEAEELFQDGRALMLEGRFEEACPKLEQSQQLEPRVGTMLNLAVCHERLGMVASAWVEFQQARDAATAEGRDKQRDLAQERIDVLGPRVPWLTVAIAEAARVEGLAISLDGAPVDPAEWGTPMAIDPGEHIIVAAAAGHAPREVRFTMNETERKTMEVAKLERLPPPPAPPEPSPPKPKPPPPPKPEKPERQRWVLELGLFGAYSFVDGRTNPTDFELGQTKVYENGTNAEASCASVGCSFPLESQHGFVPGIHLFGGYAATDWMQVGGKLLVGPRIDGGLLFGTGPFIDFEVAAPFWIGAGALLGTASATGSAEVVPAPGYYTTNRVDALSTIDIAAGPLLELSFRLYRGDAGALTLSASPMVLFGFGGGTAFGLPIAMGWRFE